MQKTTEFNEKIPTTIITGFLGSGKTSLINHLMQTVGRAKKIALIINEFGSYGMDKDIVTCDAADCEAAKIIELANGCICCTVAMDFLPAMQQLLQLKPKIEHIIIETSGLALPKPLVMAFQWHDIKPYVTVDGVITLLDAAAITDGQFSDDAGKKNIPAMAGLTHDNEMAELFQDQLAMADIVVLNKCDLISAEQQEKIVTDLRQGLIKGLRPAVPIVTTTHAKLDAYRLLGLEKKVEDHTQQRPTLHDAEIEESGNQTTNNPQHGHDEFCSFLVQFGPVAEPKQLETLLQTLANNHNILRSKGWVKIANKPQRQIWQMVGPRIQYYFPLTKTEQITPQNYSELVFIGLKNLAETEITTSLQQAFGAADLGNLPQASSGNLPKDWAARNG